MGNSLRCCLACVLPCGALDLIRIVHLSGYVEEIARPITAGEVLKANPNHVLSKPSSQAVVRGILILSPETELKRGSIYFLIPASSSPEKKRNKNNGNDTICDNDLNKKAPSRKRKKCITVSDKASHAEKTASHRERRAGLVGIWRPHLESISEDF